MRPDPRSVANSDFADVYSAGEIARAAGVHPRDVRALAEAGAALAVEGTAFFTHTEAVRAVRLLKGSASGRPLFAPAVRMHPSPGMPAVMSGTLHAAMIAVVALVTSLGVARTEAHRADEHGDLHMVFLVSPGPGGGGGGGGHKEPAPPPPALRQGTDALRSPITLHRAPKPVVAKARPLPPPALEPPPVVKAPEPPPVVKAEAMRPVFAPVAPAAADKNDREGTPSQPAPAPDSGGAGIGSGIGSGRGSGNGEGNGSGIGPGSGGGTGGGPYRPGSGISAPSILREVRPDYTDEARRRGVEGDVVLEIVVRADGSVGSVKTLQGLGHGLDQRAMDAVRQWRFNPARRYGTPVDVIVEVAVEFKLR
jgi:TonB family protein